MGTYAELYSGKDYNTIPDNKKKEFAKRIEKLFQKGRMMRIKTNILCGKRVYTIHKIKMGKSFAGIWR